MQLLPETIAANHLARLRTQLIYAVTDYLAVELVPMAPPNVRAMVGRDQLAHTVERFHDLVQLGVTADWGLVADEYGWVARVLGQIGINVDHQQTLIDAYFATATSLHRWDANERLALDQIAAQMRAISATAYAGAAARAQE